MLLTSVVISHVTPVPIWSKSIVTLLWLAVGICVLKLCLTVRSYRGGIQKTSFTSVPSYSANPCVCLLSMRFKSHEEYGTWPRGTVSSFILRRLMGVVWLHWDSMFKATVSCSGWEVNTSTLAVSGKLDVWVRNDSKVLIQSKAGEIVEVTFSVFQRYYFSYPICLLLELTAGRGHTFRIISGGS